MKRACSRPAIAIGHCITGPYSTTLGLPILRWDERLTTFAAEEAAQRAGLRGKKRAAMLDALAATAVLQDFLNTLARRRLD